MKVAKEFLDSCHKQGRRDCFKEAKEAFGSYGMWTYSLSYSCNFQLWERLEKLAGEDLNLVIALNRLLCGAFEQELEFDEQIYLRLIDLLERYARVEEDEHLSGHAEDIKALLTTALRLRSGIICY